MAELLFYNEPVPLDRSEHRELRLRKLDNLDFAKNVNSVPISGVEFFEASRDFPVLFTSTGDGEYVPAVLLSLRKTGNILADNWGEVYMPVFIRRYPFAMTESGTVVFDKQSPHLQQEEGDRLFDEQGENTEVMNTVMRFLTDADKQFQATRQFCAACAEAGLLTSFDAQVQVEEGRAVNLSRLYAIDEKKLNEFTDEQVLDWFRKGWLPWCYAHLHSLGAVRRLAKREYQTKSASQAD